MPCFKNHVCRSQHATQWHHEWMQTPCQTAAVPWTQHLQLLMCLAMDRTLLTTCYVCPLQKVPCHLQATILCASSLLPMPPRVLCEWQHLLRRSCQHLLYYIISISFPIFRIASSIRINIISCSRVTLPTFTRISNIPV